jgi:phospholipase C
VSGVSRRAFLKGGAGAAIGWKAVLDRTMAAMAAAPTCAGLADIEHVVFVIQENRSFDHYFGRYPGVRGFDDRSVKLSGGDDGTTVFRQANPGQTPNPLLPFHINTDPSAGASGECIHDVGHQWVEQHNCWADGRLDAYVKTHVTDEGPTFGPLTMGYYDRRDLAFYYALADAFTICDQYFTSVISGTVANRIMGFSGTVDPDGAGGGPIVNTPEGGNQQDYLNLYGTLSWRTMPEVLQDAGISWKFYNPPDTSVPTLNDNYLYFFKQFLTNPALAGPAFSSQTSPDDFAADCAAGQLPTVSWVNVQFLWTEHPPTPVLWGEYAVSQVLNAITSHPDLWAKTAVFLTWDDSGGFFDHVPPPVAPPGTAGEYLTKTPPVGGDGGIKGPIGLGFRVPMIVVSPWSRNTGARSDTGWRPLVCSDVLDHTSQMRFLERVFTAKGTPGIGPPHDTPWRKQTVGDLTGAFSFASKDTSVPALPPTSLPPALTFPECVGAPLTEAPFEPPLAYKPALATAAIPAQEQSGPPRRPVGLAGCDAASSTPPGASGTTPGAAGAQTGRGIAATGAYPLGGGGPVVGALAMVAGLLGLRTRQERRSPATGAPDETDVVR